MTREDAKHIVDVAFGVPQAVRRAGEDRTYHEDEIREAKKMAIKALEQEPTAKNDLGVDCISRREVLRLLANSIGKTNTYLQAEVLKMSSVTPQEPKTGHWVHGEYCSECGCDVPAYIIDWKWQKDMDAKYCPNCGCRMVESQESEG